MILIGPEDTRFAFEIAARLARFIGTVSTIPMTGELLHNKGLCLFIIIFRVRTGEYCNDEDTRMTLALFNLQLVTQYVFIKGLDIIVCLFCLYQHVVHLKDERVLLIEAMSSLDIQEIICALYRAIVYVKNKLFIL
jgi:hypothetical protein